MPINCVRLILLSSSIAIISACATAPSSVGEITSHSDGVEMITMTAGERVVIMEIGDSNLTFCAEPPPDVSMGAKESENLSGTQTDETENESMSIEVNEDSLGGRTSAVLLTREILYRTCEFLVNSELNNDEKLTLFNKSLDIISKLNSININN